MCAETVRNEYEPHEMRWRKRTKSNMRERSVGDKENFCNYTGLAHYLKKKEGSDEPLEIEIFETSPKWT